MKTSEKIDQIIPALMAVQSSVQKVGKGGKNEYDKYDYATLEDYFHAVKSHCIENHISVMTSVTDWEQLPDRHGKMPQWVKVRISITAMHDSGQWVSVDSYGEGIDKGDKATYKAITGARKYAMAMLFDLVTSDDPESGEQPQDAPERISETDAFDIQASLEELGADIEAFCKYMGVPSIGALTTDQILKANKAIEKKRNATS